MALYDIASARNEGYSDDEITQYMASENPHLGVLEAKKEGYTPEEIADYLGTQAPLAKFTEDDLKLGISGRKASEANALVSGGQPMTMSAVPLIPYGKQKELAETEKQYNDKKSAMSESDRLQYDKAVSDYTDLLSGNKNVVSISGQPIVSPNLTFDDDAYTKAVNEAPLTEYQKSVALNSLPELQKQAATPIVNALLEVDPKVSGIKANISRIKQENPDLDNASLLKKFYKEVPETERNLQALFLGAGIGWQGLVQSSQGALAAATGLMEDVSGVQAPLPSSEITGYAREAGAEAQRLGTQVQALKPTTVLGITPADISALPLSLAPSIAAGPLGLGGMAVGAGLQQFGGTYSEAEKAYSEKIKAENPLLTEVEIAKQARLQALAPATADALVTAGLTAAGGAKGVQAVARAEKQAAQTLKQKGADILKGTASEAGEEMGSQLGSGIIAQQSYDPTRTAEAILEETGKAGILGGIAGGAVEAIKVAGEPTAKTAPLAVTAPPPAATQAPAATTATPPPEGATAEDILNQAAAGLGEPSVEESQEPVITGLVQQAVTAGIPEDLAPDFVQALLDSGRTPEQVGVRIREFEALNQKPLPTKQAEAPAEAQPTATNEEQVATASTLPPVEGQPPVGQAAEQAQVGAAPGIGEDQQEEVVSPQVAAPVAATVSITDAAQELATTLGIPVSEITPKNGKRITITDVRSEQKKREAATTPATPAAPEAVTEQPVAGQQGGRETRTIEGKQYYKAKDGTWVEVGQPEPSEDIQVIDGKTYRKNEFGKWIRVASEKPKAPVPVATEAVTPAETPAVEVTPAPVETPVAEQPELTPAAQEVPVAVEEAAPVPEPAVAEAQPMAPNKFLQVAQELEAFADEEIAKAIAELNKTGIVARTPQIDAKIIPALAIKSAAILARSTVSFAQWSKQMLETYGPSIQSYLQQIWDRANEYLTNPEKGVLEFKASQQGVEITDKPRYTGPWLGNTREKIQEMLDTGLEVVIPEEKLFSAKAAAVGKRNTDQVYTNGDFSSANPHIQWKFKKTLTGEVIPVIVGLNPQTDKESAIDAVLEEVSTIGTYSFNRVRSLLKGTGIGAKIQEYGVIARIEQTLTELFPPEQLDNRTQSLQKQTDNTYPPRFRDYFVKFTKSGDGVIVSPLFTNNTEQTSVQLDKGMLIEVPSSIVESGKLNPTISVRQTSDGRYLVSEVDLRNIDPQYGIITGADQLVSNYKNSDSYAKSSEAKTKGKLDVSIPENRPRFLRQTQARYPVEHPNEESLIKASFDFFRGLIAIHGDQAYEDVLVQGAVENYRRELRKRYAARLDATGSKDPATQEKIILGEAKTSDGKTLSYNSKERSSLKDPSPAMAYRNVQRKIASRASARPGSVSFESIQEFYPDVVEENPIEVTQESGKEDQRGPFMQLGTAKSFAGVSVDEEGNVIPTGEEAIDDRDTALIEAEEEIFSSENEKIKARAMRAVRGGVLSRLPAYKKVLYRNGEEALARVAAKGVATKQDDAAIRAYNEIEAEVEKLTEYLLANDVSEALGEKPKSWALSYAEDLTPEEIADLQAELDEEITANETAESQARSALKIRNMSALIAAGYDPASLRKSLKNFSENKAMKPYVRLLAKFLLKVKGASWDNVAVNFDDKLEDSRAAGSYLDGKITLNLSAKHSYGVVSTLIHEAFHHVSLWKIRNAQNPDADLTSNERKAIAELERIQTSVKKALAKRNAEAAIAKLSPEDRASGEASARQQGYKDLLEQTTAEAIVAVDYDIAQYLKGNGGSSALYGLSSTIEFVSEVFTDKGMQELLESINDRSSRSMLGNAVRDLYQAIVRALGSLVFDAPANPDTALWSALNAAMRLTKDNSRSPFYKMLKAGQDTFRIGIDPDTGGVVALNRVQLNTTIQQTAPEEGQEVTIDIEATIREIASEPAYAGVTFVPSENLGDRAAMVTTEGSVVVRYNPVALARELAGRDAASAEEYLRLAMDEEAEHVAALNDVAGSGNNVITTDDATAIHSSLSQSKRESIARKYLGSSATQEEVTAFANDPIQLGYEYLRQVRQNLLYGKTTESVREIFDQPQGVIDTVIRYLDNLFNRLSAILAVTSNPRLRKSIQLVAISRSVLQNKAILLAQYGLPEDFFDVAREEGEQQLQLFTLTRARTTALSRVMQQSSPEAVRENAAITYLPASRSGDISDVRNWLNKNLATGLQLEDLVDKLRNDLPYGGLSSEGQRQIAKIEIAQKFLNMARLIEGELKNPKAAKAAIAANAIAGQRPTQLAASPTEKAVLVAYYKKMESALKLEVASLAHETGDLLSTFGTIADMVSSDYMPKEYSGTYTKQHAEKLAGNVEVQSAKDAVEQARVEGAASAVDKAEKLIRKVARKNRKNLKPKAGDTVLGIFDQILVSTPLGVQYAEAAAKKIASAIMGTASVSTKQPAALLRIQKDIESQISYQLEEMIRERNPQSNNKYNRDEAINALAGKLDLADLAERAFNSAVQAAINDPASTLTDLQKESLGNSRFDASDIREAQRIIRNEVDLKNIIKDSLVEQESTRESFIGEILSNTDLTPEQAESVAEALRQAYEIEARKAAKQKLETIERNRAKSQAATKINLSNSDKLLQMVNLGAFSEEKFYNAIAPTYGLPSYDEAFAKYIEAEASRIQKLEVGSLPRREQTTALLTKIARKLASDATGMKKSDRAKLYADVATAVWQAGVLSGIPTQLINLLMSYVSIVVETASKAISLSFSTGNPVYLVEAVVGIYQGMFGSKTLKAEGLNEVINALKVGTTKYRNLTGQALGTLETVSGTGKVLNVLSNWKYVGRVMLALDAFNMAVAERASERMAARFFLQQEQGLSGVDLQKAMAELFSPDAGVILEARNTALAEKDAGLYSGTEEDQMRMVERRTAELLRNKRGSVVSGMLSKATDDSERFTYNSAPRGVLGVVMGQLTGFINKKLKFTKYFLSFMDTMSNIINQTLDYTPYGYLRGANVSVGQMVYGQGKEHSSRFYTKGSDAQLEQYGRASVGSLLLGVFILLTHLSNKDEDEGKEPWFKITGDGPVNAQDRKQLEATKKWRRSSILIGGKWFRYVDFPIISIPFAAIGAFNDNLRYRKGEMSTAARYAAAFGDAVACIASKNMISGLANLVEYCRPGNLAREQSAKKIVGGVVGGYSNPNLFRWARNTFVFDKNGNVPQLDTYSDWRGWAYSLVPFSLGYATPALNTLGEPVSNPWYSATTWRVYDAGLPPHPVISPIVESGMFLPNPSKNTQFRYIKDGKITETKMGSHPEIYRRYTELRGVVMKQMLQPAVIDALKTQAKINLNTAQHNLDSQIGARANEIAVSQIQNEILSGKMKVE